MAEEDVTVAPESVESGVAPENKDTGEESSSSGSWPADAQAEYTRKTQALAEERKSWEAERNTQTQQLQHYAQQLQQQQFAAQQQAQQNQHNQQQQQSNTMLDQLRQMPYLDGNTAAQLMERMVNEGINPLSNALRQRDQAIAHLHKEQKDLKERYGDTQNQQAQKELDARILQLRQEQGLPDSDVVHEMMRDIYYSHLDDDALDAEYPEMLRKRWESLQKAVRDGDRAVAMKAKESPFPSKGGEVSPTSGKTGGYKTPEDRANELWPMINPGQSE